MRLLACELFTPLPPSSPFSQNLASFLQDVAVLDVRGIVKTQLQSTNSQGCRLEMPEYFAEYDLYLEGHIPGTAHPAVYICTSRIQIALQS